MVEYIQSSLPSNSFLSTILFQIQGDSSMQLGTYWTLVQITRFLTVQYAIYHQHRTQYKSSKEHLHA